MKLLPKVEEENIKEELQRKLMECQSRDDYKELTQLAMIYLAHLDRKDVGFRSPGPQYTMPSGWPNYLLSENTTIQ